jgi:hypothetical protein
VDVPAPKIAASIVDVPSKTTEKLERSLRENDVKDKWPSCSRAATV